MKVLIQARIEEEKDRQIIDLAEQEERTKASMIRQLINEALLWRKLKGREEKCKNQD